MPVYLRAENPLVSDLRYYRIKDFEREIQRAKSLGHDSVFFPKLTYEGESGTVAVFSPVQIKSAIGNRGTFDPADMSILADLEPNTDAYDIATVLAARVAEESAKSKEGLPFDRLFQQLREEFPETVTGFEDDIKITADGLLKEARRQALQKAARGSEERVTARRELARDAADARRAVRAAEREVESKRKQVEVAWERESQRAAREAEAAYDKAQRETEGQRLKDQAELLKAERDAQKVFERDQRRAIAEEAKRIRQAQMLEERQQAEARADEAREELKRTRQAIRDAIKAESREARARRQEERKRQQRERRWDYPIQQAAEAAQARIAADPNYKPTVDDLAAIISVKRTQEGMTTSRLHSEMISKFGDSYTKNASRIRDAAANMRRDAVKADARRRVEQRAAGKAEGVTKPEEQRRAREDYQAWQAERLRELAEEEAYQIRREQAAKRDLAREFAVLQKPSAFDTVADILGLPCAFMASIDLPFLRQGIIPTLTHPVLTFQSFVKSMSTWTEAQMNQKTDALESHELADLARLSGLKQSSVEARRAPLSRLAREEQFQNRFAQWFIHARVSERQYTIGLDTLRMALFERFASRMLEKYPPARNPEVYESLAGLINVWTGVGDLGGLTKYAPLMNHFVWSSRLYAARIQFLAEPLRWKSMPPPVRRLAIRHWLQFMTEMFALFGLAALFGLTSLDLDDDDFLKIHIPGTNRHFDITGGMGQYIKIVGKLARSVYRKSTNQKEFEGDGIVDNLARFGRSKLAPAPGAVVDYATGRTFTGEPVPTPGQRALDSITPMAAKDIYEGIKLDGMSSLYAVPFILLGGSASTYPEKTMPDKTGSEAERYAQGFARQKLGDKPETMDEYKRRTAITELVAARKSGKPTDRQMKEIEAHGGPLTEKEQEAITERVKESPLLHAYKGLSGDEKEEVLKVATPAERAQIEPSYKNIKERLDALRGSDEYKAMNETEKVEAVREVFKQERAATKKNPTETDTERELRQRVEGEKDKARDALKARPEFRALNDEQKKKALEDLTALFSRQFNVSKDVQKLPAEARSQRAKRSLEILERYSSGGVIERQIQNILLKAKRTT